MTMTTQEMKTLHPETAAALVAEGQANERDRARAHLTMGRKTGRQGMQIALAAIESGARLDAKLSDEYLDAGLRSRDIADRQADSDEAGAVVAGLASSSVEGQDLGDLVADRLGAPTFEQIEQRKAAR